MNGRTDGMGDGKGEDGVRGGERDMHGRRWKCGEGKGSEIECGIRASCEDDVWESVCGNVCVGKKGEWGVGEYS